VGLRRHAACALMANTEIHDLSVDKENAGNAWQVLRIEISVEDAMHVTPAVGPRRIRLGLAALLAAAVPSHAALAAEASAIQTLSGSWGGSGRISYTDGSSESIRCTAYYTGGGSALKMAIQCKSESNSIHVRSQLRFSGNRASGEWEERTFNASGSASGQVGGSSMSLSLGGGGFSGTMSVSFSSQAHSVTITTQGIAMNRATMSFSRR
jgi:hypothetical protein